MSINKQTLDNIFNTDLKLKIIRLFTSRREDYTANGREVARKTGFTAPAAHTALKDLYSQDILKLNIIGKQHLYSLNFDNRIVKEILIPAFTKELSLKEDISQFIKDLIFRLNIADKISSVYLYGSFVREKSNNINDVDIAIVVKDDSEINQIEKIFREKISNDFYNYFGAHLDVYIKSKEEFIRRIREELPPVSGLIKSHMVVYGKDITELK